MEFIGLAAIFSMTNLWFWVICLIGYFSVAALAEYENGFGATVAFIISLVAINYLTDIKVFSMIKENPILILDYALVYIVLGVLFSMYKFWRKLQIIKQELDKEKAYSISMNRTFTPEYASAMKRFSDMKSDIMRWMMYWFFLVFWTLINDPIKRLFKLGYNLFINIYKEMYVSVLGDYVSKKDIK